MKRAIFINVIFLMTFHAFSQIYEYIPFPDSGAIWSEVYQRPLDMYGNYPPPIFERFTVNGEDTIINETEYKKLYLFSDSVFNKSKAICIGGIREDENKRVYFKGDTVIHAFKPMIDIHNYEEILLFDFSVNIGDTIWEGNYPDGVWQVVCDIDTIQIGENLRKRIHFQDYYWVKWIEGIGSVRGLLFTTGDLPMNGLNNDLICFKQNEEILYFNVNYPECFPVLSGIETKNNDHSGINAFPNPTNGSISFKLGEQQINFIQIIDCNGRVCGSFDVQKQSDFLLSTEKYRPGIYFYKATNMNGMVHTGKFVVQ